MKDGLQVAIFILTYEMALTTTGPINSIENDACKVYATTSHISLSGAISDNTCGEMCQYNTV